MNAAYGNSQLPLAGAILCCTAIPPEQRGVLMSIGGEMGAVFKLDLTSDVTHLIVGNINSAKYRYVAKSREDVKVVTAGWLEALRDVWLQGEDVDVAAIEKEYRLPTFYNLKICLTGFDNPEQRRYIQETAEKNGAKYHGDLTKLVTHLIAANPTGKKYEHAVNWRMKVVSLEWFEQSLERGMTLDEEFYNPTMPIEERGKGAWDRRRSMSPILGKRTRGPAEAPLVHPLKRKLRRSASSKLGSQSEALWAGITAAGSGKRVAGEDDWTEEDITHTTLQTADTTAGDNPAAQGPAVPENLQVSDPQDPRDDSIFKRRLLFPYGFPSDKTRILREHLASNGAVVIQTAAELLRYSSDDLKRGYMVIPHDARTDLTSLPNGAESMTLTTNWWVERCLHSKCLVDPTEHVLCRPFSSLAIPGFNNLTINSTAFTGIELLHVTKAVAIMGATYDEYLTTKTSVLVCNTRNPNPEKIKFTREKRIPVVHASWLWECLRTSKLQPFDEHLLNTNHSQPQKRQRPQQPFIEVPTVPIPEKDVTKSRKPKPHAVKPTTRPQSRNGVQRPLALNLTASNNPTPTSTTASSTHPNMASDWPRDEDDSIIPAADGPASFPLQDINPSVNSPRRPSTSSSTSNAKSTSSSSVAPRKPLPAARSAVSAKGPTPDSIIPPPTESAPEEKDYSSIMSNILAQRKAAAEQNLLNQDTSKRRRQLGRAISNPSTGDDALSRTSSAAGVDVSANVEEEREAEETGREVGYQPSQELGWDAPEAQEARERMIRAMGGKVEETEGVVERIGVMRDMVGADSGLGRAGRSARKRG